MGCYIRWILGDQGLLVGLMRFFSGGKGSPALDVNFRPKISRPPKVSLRPAICLWVSEDVLGGEANYQNIMLYNVCALLLIGEDQPC